MKQRTIAALGCAGIIALFVPNFNLITWNHTPSIPVGFYVRSFDPIEIGSTVSFPAPQVARDYAIVRGGTGMATTFIKPLAAGPGDEVCVFSTQTGEWLLINSRLAMAVHSTDRHGNKLPHWLMDDCRRLASDEWLPIGSHPDSFDGRYFGPIRRDEISGPYRALKMFD